nr:phospholipid-transporting ATPase ABCA3-like [Dermacentor andersoni]
MLVASEMAPAHLSLGDAKCVRGRICAGSPTFLKQRFGTGYRMLIHKLPKCDVESIETLLRKYAPKARLQSDSINEAVFLLGQIVSTKGIVTMFRDIEKHSKALGIESLGMTVTSLEDVLIRVGEEHHLQHQKHTELNKDEASMIETKESLVNVMANTVSSNPGPAGRMWAMFCKRAICVSRQLKVPLFSWLLPMMLLWLLFTFEGVALYRSEVVTQHVGNTLSYTFIELVGKANGFAQVTQDGAFYIEYVQPMLHPDTTHVDILLPDQNVEDLLLSIGNDDLRQYVFRTHFVLQLLEQGRTVLWYNGEIQHVALLVLTLFNNARLRYVSGKNDALFNFEVTVLDYGVNIAADDVEEEKSPGAYRELLPKVLRSIFFPMVSSLMCSNFVLFPITERASQVKHLHIIAGIGPFLYWITNFLWDFMFYMGTAIIILPPIAYFHAESLNFNYIPSLCCTGCVFMEHYAETLSSVPLTVFIATVLQFARLLPSYSYSRGMTKVLQLASENAICRRGGQVLDSACQEKSVAFKKSLQQCCTHIADPDRMLYVIGPLDMHGYSAFYEVITLLLEGPLLFGLLLYADYHWLRRIDRFMSLPEPDIEQRLRVSPGAQVLNAGLSPTKPASKQEDTDVVNEDKLVAELVEKGQKQPQPPSNPQSIQQSQTQSQTQSQMQSQTQSQTQSQMQTQLQTQLKTQLKTQLPTQLPIQQQPQLQSPNPDSALPTMVVYRLQKTYGYVDNKTALQGLSFTVRAGECFGLLGVNGAGKTTTFKILTGEILPHEGDAFIGDVSVVRNVYEFQQFLGYCPQSNALLDTLTGIETLMLYIRLRGIPVTKEYVDTLLEIFNMVEIGAHLVGTYSAGNRRKLSLCVSLIGMPRMLLLDEPYSGMGILSRKRIVNYISSLQKQAKISIVLSSHSLTDVEFLCHRIAILRGGKLQCLGSLSHLKEKFGKGYTITVKSYPDKKQDFVYQREVVRDVRKNFPDADLVHSYEGLLEFRVSRVHMLWSEMFTRMAKIKKRFKLQEVFVADTSLEQIFVSVTRKEASEAAAAAASKTVSLAGTSLGI